MKRVIAALLLSSVLCAASAQAAGLDLAWNACRSDGGVGNRNFACNTNTGTNNLVGSFELGADIPGVTGVEVIIDLASASTTLPAWWLYFAAGSCRSASLTSNSTISPLAVNCSDWAQGAAAGGIAAYKAGPANPYYPRSANLARVIIGYAVPTPTDVFAGTEMFAFNLNFNNAKTVGTGACAGCSTPVCILLNSINVVPGTAAGTKLTSAANGVDSNVCTWQGGAGVTSFLGSGCPLAVPTRNHTWGELKSLYR